MGHEADLACPTGFIFCKFCQNREGQQRSVVWHFSCLSLSTPGLCFPPLLSCLFSACRLFCLFSSIRRGNAGVIYLKQGLELPNKGPLHLVTVFLPHIWSPWNCCCTKNMKLMACSECSCCVSRKRELPCSISHSHYCVLVPVTLESWANRTPHSRSGGDRREGKCSPSCRASVRMLESLKRSLQASTWAQPASVQWRSHEERERNTGLSFVYVNHFNISAVHGQGQSRTVV